MLMLMKYLLIFSLLLILTKCEKLTKEENDKLQSICGTKKGLLLEKRRKVLNGVPINDTIQAPWTVSIVITDKNGMTGQCSGTLISQRHVLTARHCFLTEDLNSTTKWSWRVINHEWNYFDNCEGDDLIVPPEVNDGATYLFNTICSDFACKYENITSDMIKRKAKKMILPGMCAVKRTSWYINKDFAIVELENDLILSDSVFPACVNKPALDKEGEKVWFSGYGFDEKSKKYPTGILKYSYWKDIMGCANREGERLGDYWFCTINSDKQMSCSGDSGGGGIMHEKEKATIIGVFVRMTNCSNPKNGVNYYVNVSEHLGDVCKLAGVCGNVFNNFKTLDLSIFGIILIAILRMH